MDTAWIHFCVLAIVTSITYSTKQKTEGDNRQQSLSQLSSHRNDVTSYIDLSVSLLGQNLSQHTKFINETISNVDAIFQKQLNTSIILSNFQTIPMTSELEAISNNDTLRSFELIMNKSASDSAFLIRVFPSPSVESTFDTMCSKSFTGGVINVVAMDDAQTLARQLMYGLGRNLGFINFTSAPCKCQAQTVCMMAETTSPQNPISISVSNCNINKFNQREKSCLIDSQLPNTATCGNGLVEGNEQCDCLPDDSECKQCCENCLFRKGAECSNGSCCFNCQFRISEQCQNCTLPSGCAEKQNGCNPWNCICKSIFGKEAIAASSECLDKLQANASSAFCGMNQNCSILLTECDIVLCRADEFALPVNKSLKVVNVSISGSPTCRLTECDIVLCRADEFALPVNKSLKVVNVSISGSPTCSNLYAVGSAVTDDLPQTDGMACQENGVCVSGKCDPQGRLPCDGNEGTICLNGEYDNKTNKCLCGCEWTGRLCDTHIPESERKCVSGNGVNIAKGIQTTHIIAVFIGIVFAAAVVSGATSVGYKRLQKRNRLQTKHERNMLSLFEPTKEQKKRLARHCNKRIEHDFHYNERYRIPTDKDAEERLMDEGRPPPRLCTVVKHSSRDVSTV